ATRQPTRSTTHCSRFSSESASSIEVSWRDADLREIWGAAAPHAAIAHLPRPSAGGRGFAALAGIVPGRLAGRNRSRVPELWATFMNRTIFAGAFVVAVAGAASRADMVMGTGIGRDARLRGAG